MMLRAIYGKLGSERPLAVEALRSARLSFKKGRIIRSAGAPNARVYTLFSGWAVASRRPHDGRRQVLSIFVPGDFIGLTSLLEETAQSTVEALTDVSLCAFDREEFIAFMARNQETQISLEREHARVHAAMASLVVALGKLSATQRVADFLLRVRDRLATNERDKTVSFALPLRREDLADALGLTTVHVSRTLSELKAMGGLKFDNHVVTILDNELIVNLDRAC